MHESRVEWIANLYPRPGTVVKTLCIPARSGPSCPQLATFAALHELRDH